MSAMMPWMRQTEDELISAYIDGQLDDPSRQSFEARINADPALHKRVEATRTLVKTARQTPVVVAPRNFTLPRAATAARRDMPTSRLVWRIGSALAAAVFVIAIGLDTIGVTQPAARPAPRAVQSFAVVAPPTTNSAEKSSDVLPASGASDQAPPTMAPAATEAPAAPSFKAAPLNSAPTETPEADSTPQLKVLAAARMAITPTANTVEPRDTSIAALSATQSISPTSASAPVPPVEPAIPPVDPLQIIAILAVFVAVITGIAGWALRQQP